MFRRGGGGDITARLLIRLGPGAAGAAVVLVLTFAATAAAVAPSTVTLRELDNRPLFPSGGAAARYDSEATSAVLPPGSAACPAGCIVMGYADNRNRLMRGELSCLGAPNCMTGIEPPPPPGKVQNVNGTPMDGKCTGGTTSNQDSYVPDGFDTMVIRTDTGAFVFARAAQNFFAHPAANCQLNTNTSTPPYTRRQVNLVSRSVDGGITWPAGMARALGQDTPGTPATSSGVDRPELYQDPYTKAIYLSGGASCAIPANDATTEPAGVCTSVLFRSEDDGDTWVKAGSPLKGLYGPYEPLYMHATQNRLFMAVCGDNIYPPDDLRPVLGWSIDKGSTWTTTDGGADVGDLSKSRCGIADPAKLAGGYSSHYLTTAALAAHGYSNGSDLVRLAFPRVTSSGQEVLKVVNVAVAADDTFTVSNPITIKPSDGASVIHHGFVRTEPYEMPDGAIGSDTAVLWWLEAEDPAKASPARITARYRYVTGLDQWSSTRRLSVVRNAGSLTGTLGYAWEPNLNGGFGGHFQDGAFFYEKDTATFNFFVPWHQSHATALDGSPIGPNLYTHFNVVAMRFPSIPPAKELPVSPPVIQAIDPDKLAPGKVPRGCLQCPPLELAFYLERAGRVSIAIDDGSGRRLGAVSVKGRRGLNFVRVGGSSGRGASRRLTYGVRLRYAGNTFTSRVRAPAAFRPRRLEFRGGVRQEQEENRPD